MPGLLEFALVHSGAPSGRRVYSCSLGFTHRAFARRVHSVSHGFTGARLGVAGFIRVRLRLLVRGGWFITVRVSSLRRTKGSQDSFCYSWVHSARLVLSGLIRVSVSSLGCAEETQGSFLFACVYSGARKGLRVHSGSRRFTPSRVGVCECIRVCLGSVSACRGCRVHTSSLGNTRARLGVFGFI